MTSSVNIFLDKVLIVNLTRRPRKELVRGVAKGEAMAAMLPLELLEEDNAPPRKLPPHKGGQRGGEGHLAPLAYWLRSDRGGGPKILVCDKTASFSFKIICL